MTTISASLVKQLRDKTGAGMMDCKQALTECAGDMEKATDFLRKKGLATAQKRAGRAMTADLRSTSCSAWRSTLSSYSSPAARRGSDPLGPGTS